MFLSSLGFSLASVIPLLECDAIKEIKLVCLLL